MQASPSFLVSASVLEVEFRSQSNYKALAYFRPFQAKGKPLRDTVVPIKIQSMATVKTSTTAEAFKANQIVKRSTAAVIKRLDGVKIDRFVKHTDLVGAWEGADETRAYAGLVPVISGTERFDLALLTFDLLAEDIPTYPEGDEVVFATPTDDLHKEAAKFLADNANATYDAWLDHLVSKFASGGWVDVFSYPARTKKGGKWNNAIFGASLTQKS